MHKTDHALPNVDTTISADIRNGSGEEQPLPMQRIQTRHPVNVNVNLISWGGAHVVRLC